MITAPYPQSTISSQPSRSRIHRESPEREHNARLGRTHQLSIQPLELRTIGTSDVLSLTKDRGFIRRLVITPSPIEIQPRHRIFGVHSLERSCFVIGISVAVEDRIPQHPAVCIIQQKPCREVEARDGVVVLSVYISIDIPMYLSNYPGLPFDCIVCMRAFRRVNIRPLVLLFNGGVGKRLSTGMLAVPYCVR